VCYPLIGLHPTSVDKDFREELSVVEYWLGRQKFYGIGEIGIDLYWDRTFIEQQKEAFTFQVRLAKKHGLPIVIHVRESFNEVYDIVRAEQDGTLKGIFHCFSGDEKEAGKITDLGFLLGIGGVVTYKNSNLAEVIRNIDIKNIVLETDSPYLSPEPRRGKRNESANLVYVAKKVSEIYQLTVKEVTEITTANARSLFGI
jgi:TatD DNase family protein